MRAVKQESKRVIMITPKIQCQLYCKENISKCPVSGLPVFAGVPKAAWEEFRARRTSNIYRKGNIIFYDGNRPLGMYFICSGRVKIVKYESGFHSNIARVAQAPDLLGDRAFFAGDAYRGSGEVMEESRICFIDRDSFERLFLAVPGVARRLLARLAVELGQAEERLLDLAFKTARERAAKYIVEKLPAPDSAQKSGGAPPRIRFSESRIELAKILGTTPEALSRILAEFRSKGWVAVNGKEISVLDRGRLAKVAG